MDPLKQITDDLHAKVEKSVKHLKDQLAGIRTGRASPALVDTIKVDYYGTMTLLIKPFDQSPPILKEIEKAIQKSSLGLNPQLDGKVVRLSMPPLSGEQRQKLAAKVKEITETSRVALRNERRDANKHADQAKKDGTLTEDQCKKLHEKVDLEIKAGETKLEEILKLKSKEILEE
jgi:ribosome recycling factor